MVSWSYDIVSTPAPSIAKSPSSPLPVWIASHGHLLAPRARAVLISRREFQLAFISFLIVALKGPRAGMQVDSDFVSVAICQGMYREDEINTRWKRTS